jgi:hypothetical protein
MNADTARLRIGTVPHLPPALPTDLIISYLNLVCQREKQVSSVQTHSNNECEHSADSRP